MRYMLMLPELTTSSLNYYLSVDMGRIPILLAQRGDWEVAIASEVGAHLPAPLTSIAFGEGSLSSLACIWSRAHEVDVLQLMHFTWRTALRAVVYKLRNPRGICYVKLDISAPALDLIVPHISVGTRGKWAVETMWEHLSES